MERVYGELPASEKTFGDLIRIDMSLADADQFRSSLAWLLHKANDGSFDHYERQLVYQVITALRDKIG